jgi:3-oxoadipate enol-lactonase
MRQGSFAVSQGELFFEWAGEGEPVVFLHGFGLDSRMWSPQFEALQPSFRVLRYDLRGFGRSSAPNGEYAHEDDLRSLLTHLGVQSVHVVGLSMGSRMSLRFASAHPAMVRSLVLADSAVDGYPWSENWLSRWKAICGSAATEGVKEANRQWLAHPLFEGARNQPICAEALARMVGEYSGWHWQHKDPARSPEPGFLNRLGDIRCPSLVVTGSLDLPDFQAIGEILSSRLPAARRMTIEGAGHMVNLEAPDRFNRALFEFWQAPTTA